MTVTSAACKASAARGLGRWRSWSMARARACVRARARGARHSVVGSRTPAESRYSRYRFPSRCALVHRLESRRNL